MWASRRCWLAAGCPSACSLLGPYPVPHMAWQQGVRPMPSAPSFCSCLLAAGLGLAQQRPLGWLLPAGQCTQHQQPRGSNKLPGTPLGAWEERESSSRQTDRQAGRQAGSTLRRPGQIQHQPVRPPRSTKERDSGKLLQPLLSPVASCLAASSPSSAPTQGCWCRQAAASPKAQRGHLAAAGTCCLPCSPQLESLEGRVGQQQAGRPVGC